MEEQAICATWSWSAFCRRRTARTSRAPGAIPTSRSDFASPDYYAHIGRVLEAGKFQLGLLRRPPRHAGVPRRALRRGRRPRHPLRQDGPHRLPHADGHGHRAARPRLHLLHHLLPPLPRRAPVPDARPDDQRPRRLERRHLHERRRGAEHGRSTRPSSTTRATTAPTSSWRSCTATGTPGPTTPSSSTRRRDASPIPDKVHRLDHKGEHFRSRGPFTVPRSAQGHPVVIQAGQSGRGRRFAARWGELIFTSNPNLEPARKAYAELKADAASLGRNPEHLKIATLCHPVVAATKAEAEDKFALIERLPLEVDSLMLLSENTNFDFGSKPLDEPFTDAELASFSGTQSGRDRVVAALGDKQADAARLHHHHAARQAAAALGRRAQGGRRHRSRSGSRRPPATASSSVPPACRAATRISSRSSCRSCSAAGCSRRTTRARR